MNIFNQGRRQKNFQREGGEQRDKRLKIAKKTKKSTIKLRGGWGGLKKDRRIAKNTEK